MSPARLPTRQTFWYSSGGCKKRSGESQKEGWKWGDTQTAHKLVLRLRAAWIKEDHRRCPSISASLVHSRFGCRPTRGLPAVKASERPRFFVARADMSVLTSSPLSRPLALLK